MERTHPAGVEEVQEAVKRATSWHFDLTRKAAMGENRSDKRDTLWSLSLSLRPRV